MATFPIAPDHYRKPNKQNSLARPLWSMCLYPNPDYRGRVHLGLQCEDTRGLGLPRLMNGLTNKDPFLFRTDAETSSEI